MAVGEAQTELSGPRITDGKPLIRTPHPPPPTLASWRHRGSDGVVGRLLPQALLRGWRGTMAWYSWQVPACDTLPFSCPGRSERGCLPQTWPLKPL